MNRQGERVSISGLVSGEWYVEFENENFRAAELGLLNFPMKFVTASGGQLVRYDNTFLPQQFWFEAVIAENMSCIPL